MWYSTQALIYELSVLKQYAEPLLFGIKPEEPEYLEAKRLLKFLNYFQGIDSNMIPGQLHFARIYRRKLFQRVTDEKLFTGGEVWEHI